MTAPLRTTGQFLLESGFGQENQPLSFPEYPDVDAQLKALRKLDPRAREISWIEYHLERAREARLVDDLRREAGELAAARAAVEKSFKRRTPPGAWPKLMIVLAIIGLVGLLMWLEKRKRKRIARRRQNYLAAPFPDRDEDEDDEEQEDE